MEKPRPTGIGDEITTHPPIEDPFFDPQSMNLVMKTRKFECGLVEKARMNKER